MKALKFSPKTIGANWRWLRQIKEIVNLEQHIKAADLVITEVPRAQGFSDTCQAPQDSSLKP
jgi:hypothetical protein